MYNDYKRGLTGRHEIPESIGTKLITFAIKAGIVIAVTTAIAMAILIPLYSVLY